MKHTSAIVLAAGRGLRFKSKIPKPLVKINSKPIVIYSLDILSKHSSVQDIIVVANDKNSKEIIRKVNQYRIQKIKRIVKGGRRRQDSVANALSFLSSNTDLVLIHDAARPFIDKNIVSRLIKESRSCGAAIAGVPVKATIKEVKRSLVQSSSPAHLNLREELKAQRISKNRKTKRGVAVERTLDRSVLWEIQTPQVFRKDLILDAYKRFGHLSVTDDAMLVEKMGHKVRVVLGSCDNIKITTPEDLVIAGAILKAKSEKRKVRV